MPIDTGMPHMGHLDHLFQMAQGCDSRQEAHLLIMCFKDSWVTDSDISEILDTAFPRP
jgi:hypothetical protein